jgi:hypothetical protein
MPNQPPSSEPVLAVNNPSALHVTHSASWMRVGEPLAIERADQEALAAPVVQWPAAAAVLSPDLQAALDETNRLRCEKPECYSWT